MGGMTKNADTDRAPLTPAEAAQLLKIACQANVDAALTRRGEPWVDGGWPLADLVAEAQKPGVRHAGARILAGALIVGVGGRCECGQPLAHEPGECPAIPTPEMEIEIWDEMLRAAARGFSRDRHDPATFAELAHAAANYATSVSRSSRTCRATSGSVPSGSARSAGPR